MSNPTTRPPCSNYVSYKAIAMSFFRLFFPHAAVFGAILKWLRIVPRPKTERDKEAAALPINCRYSRDIGVLQLTVFLVVLSYGSEWLLRSNVWEGCRPWPSAVH